MHFGWKGLKDYKYKLNWQRKRGENEHLSTKWTFFSLSFGYFNQKNSYALSLFPCRFIYGTNKCICVCTNVIATISDVDTCFEWPLIYGCEVNIISRFSMGKGDGAKQKAG